MRPLTTTYAGKTTITLSTDELLSIAVALDEQFTWHLERDGVDENGDWNVDPAHDDDCKAIEKLSRKISRAIGRATARAATDD